MSKFGIAWAWVKGVFSFGSSGTESVIDYVLACFYEMLDRVDIGGRILDVHEYAEKTEAVLAKYRGWCPEKWIGEYDSLVSSVILICDITEDGKVTKEEFFTAVNCFKTSYKRWIED